MRFPLPPAWLLLLAITIATATTNTISLSDFSPRITISLTPACNTVYNEVIQGCTAGDFLSGTACSKTCLQGLVQITNAVQASCQKDVVSESSVIGLFRAGLGIQVLCDVAVVTTTAGGHSAAPAPATESIGQSTMKVSSVAATTGSLLTDTSVPSAPSMTSVMSPPPISMTLSSAASSSSVSKPSTPSPSKSSTSTSSKTSSSSAQSASQKSGNNQSGGGSPFDITGNSLGWHAASVNLGAILSAVALAVVLLLR